MWFPLGGGLLLSETIRVVTLLGEELLEMRLAVVLSTQSSKVTQAEGLLAVLALHASLVEDLVVGDHALHSISSLAAHYALLVGRHMADGEKVS